MDIWKWVEEGQEELEHQGHHRLAHLMRVLSSYTVDENHAQVDAIVPEALALARAIKNPWIEVFIRHWHLQSQVLHRYEVTKMLPEAVNLLEFAYRDNTRDCPQSICVVQDIANCYGLADGPGYVEERLTVAAETLAKIDASWPCFVCISAEYIDALLDGQRYEEALTFLEQQQQALLLANQSKKLEGSHIEILIKLKRYEEAYDLNKDHYEPDDDQDDLLTQAIDEARITAYLGRYDDAKSVLPDFSKIAPTSDHYIDWADAVRVLVKARVIPNDWHLNAQFQQMSTQLADKGVIRYAFTLTLWQAELALKRGNPNTASRCYERAKTLIERLRKPLDANQLLTSLSAEIATALAKQSVAPFSENTPEQVLETLGKDPESDLDILETARQRWPEHESLALITAKAYDAMGEPNEGKNLLTQYINKYPHSSNAVLQYGFLLLNDGSHQALQHFASSMLERDLEQEVHLNCHWLLALQYQKDQEWELAKQHLSSLLAQQPTAFNSRMLLAELERKTGQLETALQHLNRLVELNEQSGDHDWDRMVVATLLEDWDTVRHSADRLGFKELPTEGPIDQEMGTCLIQFNQTDGEPATYYALRTGPVTARIVEISAPNDTQHYSDTVVFEPVQLNKPKQRDEEEADNQYPLYASLQTIQQGHYSSYSLDGVHPGQEQVLELKQTLESLGGKCQVQSGENYQIHLDETEEPLLGLYAYIAVPEKQPLPKVADLLATVTKNYAHPLIWLDMIEKIGDEEELERQRVIEKKYGL